MKRRFYSCLSSFALLTSATLLIADEPKREAKPAEAKPATGERKPSEATPKGERKPDSATPRGERPAADPAAPRGERPAAARDGGGRRSEFPAEIKLTDDQQKKLEELRTEMGPKFAELSTQRDAIYTEEQKTARTEAEKKIREGGLSRQEITDLIASTVKLTPEQKTKIEAVEQEANKLRTEIETKKTALLTDEQKATLRKLMAAREFERVFTLPGDVTLTDEQKKGLKSLQEELTEELKTLSEKRDSILTDERKTARNAVYKEARESGKDRQAMAEALDAALKLTDAEKMELADSQTKLNELQQKIQERKLALLTPEQKQEFEKKYGAPRSR